VTGRVETAGVPSVTTLRDAFDAVAPGTVGLEEEVVLLDPLTFAPVPVGTEVVARAGGDERIKLELPAAQVELLTRPHATVADAIAELGGAREALGRAAAGLALPAAAAVHPTAPALAELNDGARYAEIEERYRSVARRQLVGALQVHGAGGGAERTLAVYNALRGFLPELAALAAAAPFHEGRDTGLASVRPLIGGLLPRQGVPPVLPSWEHFAAELEWLGASRRVDARQWWFELRPHVVHGTLELRVPDAQPSLAAAEGVAAFAHALVLHLSQRFDEGHRPPPPETWRIAENRWAALRDGLEGRLADLVTGAPRPARERLAGLVDDLESETGQALDGTRALIERNTAMELRQVGLAGAARWLTERYSG
jgi:carboxylate-amine ligase